MKNLKFPGTLVSDKLSNFGRSINDVSLEQRTEALDENNAHPKSVDIRTEILKSRKFRIALITTYSFLISLFGFIVYTAILLDPKFPF